MKKNFLLLFLIILTVETLQAQQPLNTLTLTSPVKKIEVTGSAELEVIPDEIFVGITLQEYYTKTKEKITIDAISRSFLATCEKAGITKDRIEVQDMSGFDNSSWYYRKRKKEQPDLMQSTSYTIKFGSPAEIDKLVNILDDNATQNVYLSRKSNSKEKEFCKQLKIQALQNAKAKATYLLEGIGAKTGAVLFVREIEFNEAPMYKNYDRMANTMMESAGSANEGLSFRKIKYRYDVEAHFGIE